MEITDNNMEKRIEHYSLSDMAYSYSFTQTFEILKTLDVANLSIEELIGLYPATKYLDDIPSLLDEAKVIVEANKPKIKEILKQLNIYFSLLNDDVFINDIASIHSKDVLLAHNYIQALEYFSKSFAISSKSIVHILNNEIAPVHLLLEQKNIATCFTDAIKQYLLSTPEGITYLVRKYDEKCIFGKRNPYYLPSFNNEEVNSMIEKYLQCKHINLNILGHLIYHKNSKDTYMISALTKTKIRKVYMKMNDDLSKGGVVFSNDYEIRIDINQDELLITENEKDHTLISYGGKWIMSNLDNQSTILNNLIYIFGFVDKNFRFAYLPNEHQEHRLTEILDNRNKDEYGNLTIHHIDHISNGSFLTYYSLLSLNKHNIEKVYEWFSKDYLKQFFNLEGFETHLPIDGVDSYIKCRNLFPEIDKLLKSYMVYQKYGHIEKDIYEEETLCRYGELKSLNGNKYIYGTNNHSLLKIMHLLFSDQSMLNYIDEYKKDDSFFKLLKNVEVRVTDYKDYNQADLSFLKDNDIISIQADGLITFKNIRIITILHELYFKGFLDVYHLGNEYKAVIDNMEKKSWIKWGDTLFSKQEADYLDYYLNDSKFTNALELRNKYAHPNTFNPSENELMSDYIKGLKILGLVIIKINDEFCRRFPEEKVAKDSETIA